jgi:hypothetical protein
LLDKGYSGRVGKGKYEAIELSFGPMTYLIVHKSVVRQIKNVHLAIKSVPKRSSLPRNKNKAYLRIEGNGSVESHQLQLNIALNLVHICPGLLTNLAQEDCLFFFDAF